MNKQSKAAFWEGSDQSYEIMSRSHEERGKEIIALKARIAELEKQEREQWDNHMTQFKELEHKIATLTEAIEKAHDELMYDTAYASETLDKALQATKDGDYNQ